MSVQTATTPLVRTKDGAVIGIDWRRVGGLIPGAVEARHLCPGDRIAASGVEVVVQVLPLANPARRGMVSINTLTDGGAPIMLERSSREHVTVLLAGAFDDRGRTQ